MKDIDNPRHPWNWPILEIAHNSKARCEYEEDIDAEEKILFKKVATEIL